MQMCLQNLKELSKLINCYIDTMSLLAPFVLKGSAQLLIVKAAEPPKD